MELFARHWKTAAAPANAVKLTFLHGMGGTGALWRPIAAALEDEFSVLAPDQRGHGGSRDVTEGGFTPLDYGRDVVETLERCGHHPTWLIGHSMGVRTAAAAAFLKPSSVLGMILIDLGLLGPAGGGLGKPLADFLAQVPMEFESRAEARSHMEAHCPDPAIGQYLMAVLTPLPGVARLVFPFDRVALLRTLAAAETSEIRTWVHEAARRGMPILVLRGAESRVWTHEEYENERRAAAGIPGLVFEEVTGAGHGLPFEKRLPFVERLRNFLAAAKA